MFDVLLLWVALFGVWPIADPAHGFGSVTSALDVLLHAAAVVWLATRWRLVRRTFSD